MRNSSRLIEAPTNYSFRIGRQATLWLRALRRESAASRRSGVMSVMGVAITGAALAVVGLLAWQLADRRAAATTWRELLEQSGAPKKVFDAALVKDLPEPARRYFQFMIEEGTPLVAAVEIDMRGELCLGGKEKPDCKAMRARQLLAAPHGLVWRVRAGLLSGSDGISPHSSWTRFWLLGLVPIVRAGANSDHHRSAFGRVIAEAAFWAPASLLPSPLVQWEEIDQRSARCIVSYGGLTQAVEITVAQDGQPREVKISRWSNENAEREFREQPFGGEPSDFRNFHGYTLPARVVGGNHFGTDDYFPFYRATVTAIRFPTMEAEAR